MNHFYSSIGIKQTTLYGQGRVSLGLWCRAGLVFSKTWAIKISDGSQLSEQFLWRPTATGTQQTGMDHFYSSNIWIQQTALYGQGRVSLGLWFRAGLVFSKTWVKNQ
jgi:hypothetical protein